MSRCPECDQPRLHDAFYQRWICQTPECPAPGWTYATPPNTTKENQ